MISEHPMYKQSLLFYLAIIILLSCHKDEPPIASPPPTECLYAAGNRNYTWRVDTVAWWTSTVGGIWAFSDTDAYVMGEIQGGYPSYNMYAGLHWNGKKWDTNIYGTPMEIAHYSNEIAGDDHFFVSVGYWHIGNEKAGLAEFDNRMRRWKGYQYQNKGQLYSVWTDKKGYYIAVGDSGMVYIKDGDSAPWIFLQAPTKFRLYHISGISRNEIYTIGHNLLATGRVYDQIWKYDGATWLKLFDTQDTAEEILSLTKNDYAADIAPVRCSITDSLKLYVIGDNSYLFQSKGQETVFSKTNLAEFGLALKANGRTGLDINIFSPNDYWVFGTRFNFYHYNGSNFQKIVISGLPNDDMHFGDQRKLVKTKTGKIFLPTEVASQVYVVVQGTP